ncbi:hypothetical protein GUJ93_ZPchr0002g25506 [Zizania palustris]|uniref:Uncharacterized protein n=1 Tax=Zizania palustris TaxID=103762 RepID=A0A8J5S6W9_ZIZPA|nr:hypothetical protein GUJ93_ZPchr0002g25506 [Zizania palustris]
MEGRGKVTATPLLVLLLLVTATFLHADVAAARRLGDDGGRQQHQPSPPPLVSGSKASVPSGCTHDPIIHPGPPCPPNTP